MGDRVYGEYADRVGKPVRTYGLDRVCLNSECATILSRYNRFPWCSLHAEAVIKGYRVPRRKTA